MEGLNSKLEVMRMLASKLTRMIENRRVVTYLLSTMVQLVGIVPNKVRLQILQS